MSAIEIAGIFVFRRIKSGERRTKKPCAAPTGLAPPSALVPSTYVLG